MLVGAHNQEVVDAGIEDRNGHPQKPHRRGPAISSRRSKADM
jgi:hypothetical protein